MTSDNQNIIISQANPNDAKSVQTVLKNASKNMYLACGYTEDDFEKRFKNTISQESVEKCQENIKTISDADIFLVAKNENGVIGILYLEDSGPEYILHMLYVLPEFQGKGMGMKLWKIALDRIGETERKNISLDVFAHNTQAIDFYKKIGFAQVGEPFEDPSFTSESGAQIKVIHMVFEGRN